MQSVKLGLKENWKQFTLLVIINGFVGGMVGLERSIIPQIAEVEFAMVAKSAILSFIIVFGIVKAITNYYTGALANKFGRKNLLVAGWVIGIPIPFLLMFAIQPVRKATIATAKYPANSFNPMANPLCLSPTRSIFITTVLDQVNP